ncbi:MAG: protein phosphatase 2C domain-containing protein [Cyanobacteria bacterium K_Offshore_0m_m2_072]|nr:protein phosphatase 2C domain-containing protein [Cyanobacteria bacterium K_Offshore_0m_m2_072]
MAALWPPVHASLVGARHRARGERCQDASVCLQGVLGDGLPYSLVVVADGHGDSRHYRSAIGSQLACDCTVELIQQAACEPATDWQCWLHDGFAPTLLQRWLQRCKADHHDSTTTLVSGLPAAHEQTAFSAVPYGTTLGLALLTPNWWACSGIGDWDLALLQADGARVVSSEAPQPGGGEATFSLCMEQTQAAALMRERCQWHPLHAQSTAALALVLTTDGVRKSCLSERDHLVLCHYLAKESLPADQRDEAVDLEAALEQITSRGIGDDVSVAACALGPLKLMGTLALTS